MVGVAALATVLGAPEVEEDTQQVEARSPEEERVLVAYVEGAVGGSCYSLAGDRLGVRQAVDRWREEAGGLEVVLLLGGKRVDDTGATGVRSWAAWGRRTGPPSSSWTAGSGSPPQTCRSWWWT